MKTIIDQESGELIEVEDDNEIALRETSEIINYEELYNLYEKLEGVKSQIEMIEANAKPKLIEYIKAHNNEPIRYFDLTISLRKGYMSTKFDSKKFKQDHEDLYNQYTYLTGIDETIAIRFGGKK